jgi:putative transposase
MARPLRLEFPGATYHVTARGDRREPIYRDDHDRAAQLGILAQACERFDAAVLAYCQMGNHFHLVLHTRQGQLSRLMRHLNGVYTQRFNARHGVVGHLFQGRFKAILVDRDAYLLTLCRYVERNPVAAGLVDAAADWPWSSCRAHLGLAAAPAWLDTPGVLAAVAGHPLHDADDWPAARAAYAQAVGQPVPDGFWAGALRQQVYLGSDAFVQTQLARLTRPADALAEVPKAQRRRPGPGFADLLAQGLPRDEALHRAYASAGVSMTALAREAGLSVSRVSRLIAAVEAAVEAKGKT